MAVKKPKTKNKNKHSNDLRVKTNHDTAVGSNMTTLPGTQARRGGSPLGTLGRIPDLPGSPAASKRLRQLRSCVGDLGRADIMQKLRATRVQGLFALHAQITDAVRRTRGRGSQDRQELNDPIPGIIHSSIHFFFQKIFTRGKGCDRSEEG